MWFLMILSKVKGWLFALIGGVVLFLGTYLLGMHKGKKEESSKQAEQQVQQEEQANQQAETTYNAAEKAIQDTPPSPVPNVEKRNDLDTDH